MTVIENITRHYKKEIKTIEDVKEGQLFEFKNELYIKGVLASTCININQGKECALRNETVYMVIDCKIEYSLIKD